MDKIRIDTVSNVKNAKFNLRLYTIEEDGKSGEYLHGKNIFGYAKKGFNKITKIDVSGLNILFPKKGFFIAFEGLIIVENKFENKARLEGEKKKRTFIRYAPNIGVLPSLKVNSWALGRWCMEKTRKN